MPDITDYKIGTLTDKIADLSDRPNETKTATQLKAYFDSQPEQIRDAFDSLIDYLLSAYETKANITTNRKLSPTGDFTGTWNGVEMTDAEPGLSSQVNALKADNAQRAINAMSAPYNATGDGATDDLTALQAAITAAANKILIIPYGTFMLSDQLVIANPMTIWCFGTLKPSTAGTAGSPLISITSSDVQILGFGRGVLDGNNKTWCGIKAEGTSAFIENVSVEGMRFDDVAIDSTSAYVINFSSVKNGLIANNSLSNCGVVGNVSGGGFGIYTQFCKNVTIENNALDTVGSAAINVSAGVGNIVCNNRISKATLYGIKTGYGNTTTVTADVTPTEFVFSIVKNSTTAKQWQVGQGFGIITSNTTFVLGIVKAITDNTTYYTISTSQLDSAPSSGQTILLPDTGTIAVQNQIEYTGDNAFDCNVVRDSTICNNKLRFGGIYTGAGTFAGLNSGIWVGADDQGSATGLMSYGVKIFNNEIDTSGGSGISVFNTHSLDIDDNKVYDFNQSNGANFGGIEAGRVGSNRMNDVRIGENQISVRNGNGYGVFLGFTQNGKIESNQMDVDFGIIGNSLVGTDIINNQIVTSQASTSGISITDTSTTNANSGVFIRGNEVRCNGASTTGIGIADGSAELVTITDDNSITATTKVVNNSSNPVTYNGEFVTPDNAIVIAAFKEAKRGIFHADIANGASADIGNFQGDNGTTGKMVIEGLARQGTTNAEGFRLVVVSGYNVSSTVKTFTSDGASRGTAFLAAGDFTVSAASDGTTTVSYTNGTGDTVYLMCDVLSLSRQ